MKTYIFLLYCAVTIIIRGEKIELPKFHLMGVDDKIADRSFRISFGRDTSDEDVEKAAEYMAAAISHLQQLAGT